MALHRTAFSPLRCVKAAVYAGVKGLAVVFLGVVYEADSGVWPRQKHTLRSGIGVGRKLGAKVTGPSGLTSVKTRPLGVLVPGAMGQVTARYREWAFSLGAKI